MSDWLFVFENNKHWRLKLTSEEEADRFALENQAFSKDYAHYEKVKDYSHDDHTAVTHSQWAGEANRIAKDYYKDMATAYDILSLLQLDTIKTLIRETGAAYVNWRMGCHGERKEKSYTAFVRRKELVFPRYHNSDIRIERFPDGTHYYAYVGDMQVRDGDILKWDSYDEAMQQAKKYVRGR